MKSIKKLLTLCSLALVLGATAAYAKTTVPTEAGKAEASACETITVQRCNAFGCTWVQEYQCQPTCHPEQVCENVTVTDPYTGQYSYRYECHYETVCN